jgi:NADH dehydrogenase
LSKIKHITIFGGTGFLGQRLAGALIKSGYQVRIPTRQRELHRHMLVLPGIELVQANPHEPPVLNKLIQGTDVVINLVGILNEEKSAEHKFDSAHVRLTLEILNACEKNSVSRYLHVSALKADEEQSPSEYLRSKGKAESLVNKSSLNTTIFRPSLMFGEGDGFVNKFAQLLKLPSPFFILPVPNARFAPVFVDDVVEGIIRSLSDPDTFNKRYSCCGPKIYSMRELIQLIARTLGVKRKIIGLGPLLSRMMANILGIFPGKPFSKDNYLSLQVNSICEENGLEKLGITPKRMDSIIAGYLKPRDNNQIYSRYRRDAGRNT